MRTVPSSVSTAFLLFALAVAVAGASLAAVAVLGSVALVIEVILFYLAGRV